MKRNNYKIIFTGGGTGGHIFPLVAIIRELKKIFPENLEIYYIGPKDNISKNYMEKEGVKVKYVLTGKLRRYWDFKSTIHNSIDILLKIPIGIIQSIFHMFLISPDLIFSKGGYGSLPCVLSGRMFQVPVFLHESDSVLGAANKTLLRFAMEVFTSFSDTEGVDAKKMVVVGNPVRKEILNGNREKGEEIFKLRKEKPLLLIMGGSQGSERINDIVLCVLKDMLDFFEVIHQCGPKNYDHVHAEANAIIPDKRTREEYHLYSLLSEEELRHAYVLADLVVSRAGSGSIFEIAAVQKPSVLLPLPEAAQNHQSRNAYFYSRTGATVILEEENLTPHFFLDRVKELFSPPMQLKVMKDNTDIFAKPRAAKIIASYIKEYLA